MTEPNTDQGQLEARAVSVDAPLEGKTIEPASKYPLKGMPFDRLEFSKQTKIEHRRAGRQIKWQEARARAYRSLILKHFPRVK